MTLASSSSIHIAQQYADDRQAEIRRDAEQVRVGVANVSASPDGLPDGVDDLTPTKGATAASRPWFGRVLSRLIPAS